MDHSFRTVAKFSEKLPFLTPWYVYSEPCQVSKLERFPKKVNGWKRLTIFAKHSILDVWQGSEYAFGMIFPSNCIVLITTAPQPTPHPTLLVFFLVIDWKRLNRLAIYRYISYYFNQSVNDLIKSNKRLISN